LMTAMAGGAAPLLLLMCFMMTMKTISALQDGAAAAFWLAAKFSS